MSDDEFLYQLRSSPSPQFAARLKARLDQQTDGRSVALRLTLIGLLLTGGVAAVAIPLVKHWTRSGVTQRVAHEAPAPQPQAPSVSAAPAADPGPPPFAIANAPPKSIPPETASRAAPAPEPAAVVDSSAENTQPVGGVPIRSAGLPPVSTRPSYLRRHC